jgi:hypothetical protein
MWMWRGRWRKIPIGYRFPGGTLKEICDLFFLGIPAERVRPFRDIPCGDFVHADEANVSKAGTMFAYMCSVAVNEGLVASKDVLYSLDGTAWDQVFKAAFLVVQGKAQATKKRRIARPEEKSYATVFDWTRHPAYNQ